MYIIAIGWIYVVFMMAITEHSVIAGIMTFLLYGILPLTIILYISGHGKRKASRTAIEQQETAKDISQEKSSIESVSASKHGDTGQSET